MSGVVLLLAGLCIAFELPLPGWGRLLVAASWATDCGLGLTRQRRGAARVCGLAVSAGPVVAARRPDGGLVELELLRGSRLTSRAAWLRLRHPDGLVHGELVVAAAQQPATWRRLSILWRLHHRESSRDAL